MSLVSVVCFGLCLGIVLSLLKRGTDLLSPARVYVFMWSLSIGLADLKLSAYQYEWSPESWLVLLTGVGAFLVGIFAAYVLNLRKEVVPIRSMRLIVRREGVHENRFFWFICASVVVYCIAYGISYLIRGFLPFFDISKSRLEFNVSGVTLFLFSVPFIIFFMMLYFFLVRGQRGRKMILSVLFLITVGSTLLLLSRYQLVIPLMMCFAFLYYSSRFISWKTVIAFSLVLPTLFFWVSTVRGSHLVASFLYYASRMKFSKDYALFTEPYMYVVMNLENFARTVNFAEYHTYGYFTFDFITAVSGLKYWIVDYFKLERAPFLVSGYNTYPSLWWFYMDFGVLGVALIPLILGFATEVLYCRMRHAPSVKSVTAYAVMFLLAFLSTYTYPLAGLFFVLTLLTMYFGLRWVMKPREASQRPGGVE